MDGTVTALNAEQSRGRHQSGLRCHHRSLRRLAGPLIAAAPPRSRLGSRRCHPGCRHASLDTYLDEAVTAARQLAGVRAAVGVVVVAVVADLEPLRHHTVTAAQSRILRQSSSSISLPSSHSSRPRPRRPRSERRCNHSNTRRTGTIAVVALLNADMEDPITAACRGAGVGAVIARVSVAIVTALVGLSGLEVRANGAVTQRRRAALRHVRVIVVAVITEFARLDDAIPHDAGTQLLQSSVGSSLPSSQPRSVQGLRHCNVEPTA